MSVRWYLEIMESGERLIPMGGRNLPYSSLAEAQEEAKNLVDDALPRNRILVLQVVDEAYCGGDGGSYLKSEE